MTTAETYSATSVRDGDRVTVAVSGDVDVLRVGQLRQTLTEALIDGGRLLVLDLEGVTFMDSVGLGVIIAAWKRARVLRIEVVVWRPSHPVATVLGLTALDRVLKVHVGPEQPGLEPVPDHAADRAADRAADPGLDGAPVPG